MKILIKFPTRSRPDLFFKTLDSYYSFAEDIKNIIFLITMDIDDYSMNNHDVQKKLLNYENLQFIYGKSNNKIHAVNRDLDYLNLDYDIILLASDDMVPEIKKYDKIIRDKMNEFYPDTDGILFFNDGFRGNELNTLCILGRKYYERFGYIYNPSYKSLFADDEFMAVGNLLNKQTYFDQCIIKHINPANLQTSEGDDEIYYLNSLNFNQDRENFLDRKSRNFDLHNVN